MTDQRWSLAPRLRPRDDVGSSLGRYPGSDFDLPVRDFSRYRSLAAAERRNARHTRGSYSVHAAITACLASLPAGNPQHSPKIGHPERS
jgi:hypothetical protein